VIRESRPTASVRLDGLKVLVGAYEQEMSLGHDSLARGRLDEAFAHFERAHILGQRRTLLHTRSHLAMLRVGWLRRDWREITGQLGRIVAATLLSRLWVPTGNTGGANVSAFKRMPVPEDLRHILDDLR